MMSESFADRAWYAYHCLPRTKRGKPPSYNSLEKAAGISSGTISRAMLGDREEFSKSTLEALARVLNVSIDWLVDGRGEKPPLTGPIPPRLPYLNTMNEFSDKVPFPKDRQAVEVAKMLVERAWNEAPNASVIELLARAQIEASRSGA
jgi:transcriptional regulator with XRE-family HTH domain